MKITLFFLFAIALVTTTLYSAEVAVEASQDGGLIDTFKSLFSSFGVKWPLLIGQIINFIIVAIVLYRFAIKPVVATLDERQAKISDGLQYAEEMKSQLLAAEKDRVEKMKETNLEAQKILNEASAQSKIILEQNIKDAGIQAEHIVQKAKQEIEMDKAKMLSDVRQEVAHLVVEVSSKVLKKNLTDEDKAQYLKSANEDLMTVKK